MSRLLRHVAMRVDQPRLEAAARALGARLQVADVILLEGPMGAGKTTFVRALAEGLGVARPQRVRSPTYNICLEHDGPIPLAHVDLFRLAADDEPTAGSIGAAAFEALGLPALVEDEAPRHVLVVEWADLWAEPPLAHIRVRLEPCPDRPTHRILVAEAAGTRPTAVLAAWNDEIAVS